MKARRDVPARKGGDRLGELFLTHASGMGRLAYLLTGDRATADDLVQEAFIRLARRFAHLRDVEAFESYFRRTIVNLARSHHRHRYVERVHGERVAALPSRAARMPDIADRETLRQALLRIPQRSRTAIVLRFYEDLSERGTAEVMGCRPGTVKALLSQGLAKLREEIRDA